MNLLGNRRRLTVSAAVAIAGALALSACAPINHRHVDSRGALTSAPVSRYHRDYAYDPYRYQDYGYYDRGYYRPNYYHSGHYRDRDRYRCDRNTDPYRNIGFENGRSYAPCYDRYYDRYYDSGY